MTGRFEPRRKRPNGYRADCGYCWLEGPDYFGNYDLIENDRCPIHGAGPEKTGGDGTDD
jgi:hypothetical protein